MIEEQYGNQIDIIFTREELTLIVSMTRQYIKKKESNIDRLVRKFGEDVNLDQIKGMNAAIRLADNVRSKSAIRRRLQNVRD